MGFVRMLIIAFGDADIKIANMKLYKWLLIIPMLMRLSVSASDSINVYSQINIYPYYFDGDEANIGILPDALDQMLPYTKVNYYTYSCSTCDESLKPDIICLPDDEPTPVGYTKHSLPLQIEYVVCFRRNEPIESLFSLSDKKVIIVRNDYPFEALYRHRTSHILNVSSVYEALRVLSEGYDDCAVLPLQAVRKVLEENRYSNIDFLPTPFIVKPLALAVKNVDPTLDSAINSSLSTILKNGKFESISRQWLIRGGKVHQTGNWPFVLIFFLLLVIALMYLWIRTLYEEIECSAREEVSGIISNIVSPMMLPINTPIIQTIMESSQYWFVISDQDGRIYKASRAFLLSALHVNALNPDSKWTDIVGPETAEKLAEYDNMIYSGQSNSTACSVDFESKHFGGERWVIKHPFKYPDRSELFILTAIVQPIYNKNLFYQNLDIQNMLQAVIDASTSMVYFKTTDGRYQQANKAFCQYFQFDVDTIAGKNDYELFGSKLSDVFAETDNVVFKDGKVWTEQTWNVDKNGDEHKFENWKFPLFNNEHKIFGLMGISRDITDIDRYAQQVKDANERLAESDRLKSSFLANLGNDVRNPIRAIIEYSDMLADIDLTYDQRIEIIEMVQSSGNMLIDLVNDMIDYSKIEAGKIQIKYSDFNLNSIVAEVYNLANNKKMQMNKDNMVISLQIDTIEDNIIVHSDSFRLKQILKNMLNTIIKFADSDRLYFGYRTTNDKVFFFVNADRGAMSRDQLLQYAAEYENQEIELSQIDESYGISIIIAQSIIGMMGGKLWVENMNSDKPSFIFYIPYEHEEETSQVIYDSHNNEFTIPDWSGKTILIAEDEELNFILIQGLMLRTKIRILHAWNGIEAVKLYKENPDIDLVLMDIRMPEMNGLEASELILEYDDKADIIAQSAYAIPEIVERCTKIGIHKMLEKPINQRELLMECAKYIKQSYAANDGELMN